MCTSSTRLDEEGGTNLSTVGRLPISEIGFDKLGHPINCLPNHCESKLLFLRQLSVHFKYVAQVVRHIYNLVVLDRTVYEIDKALFECDVEYLENLPTKMQEEKQLNGEEEAIANGTVDRPEEHLVELPYYKKLLEDFKKFRSFPCASCRRLFFERQTHRITIQNRRRTAPTRDLRPRREPNPFILIGLTRQRGPEWNDAWSELLTFLRETYPNEDETERTFLLCDKCYTSIRTGGIRPPESIFNNLAVDAVPRQISVLNEYERLCVQLAKCFQAVYRLGAVGTKLPHSDRIRVVRGQALYYPLPLSETIKQLEEAAANAPSMHILVNSVATKNPIIWQAVVNLTKVREALFWLKNNNEIYKNIKLDEWVDNIKNFIADRNLEEESSESLTQEELEKARDELKTRGLFDNNEQAPMLKQIDETEQATILDSYTIHPLDQQKPQYTDLQVYQMQHIRGEKVDARHALLDLGMKIN